jgi:hypothetical protein
MNLDSYIRLNPYSDDEKQSEGQEEGRSHTMLIGCIVLAMITVGAWMWTRNLL